MSARPRWKSSKSRPAATWAKTTSCASPMASHPPSAVQECTPDSSNRRQDISMNELHKRIFVAGHRGMVGRAIMRCLDAQGQTHIITRSRSELDLTDQAQVRAFFAEERPQEVYVAAAKVGGIHANNSFPAEFIYSNLMVEANLVHESWHTRGPPPVPLLQMHIPAPVAAPEVGGRA